MQQQDSTWPGLIRKSIHKTGEMLPAIGAGSWIQFDVGESHNERSPLLQVLKVMLEKGGTMIDSSPMYGNAEEVIGDLSQATKEADSFFYATKVWTSGKENGISQMFDSFKKMRRNKIDLMQIHNLVDWKTHIKTLQKWKEEGRIRYTGITHYTIHAHDELEKLVKTDLFDFVQFNYSIRVRNSERRLLQSCLDHGVSVIINEPFEKGALFSTVKGKKLPPWAAMYDIHSFAQFFLKFIISHPAVSCAIPGTSNPQHMLDNMNACYGRLPDEKTRLQMIRWIES